MDWDISWFKILSNASSSIGGGQNVKVEPIIITQNGIGEELLKILKL